MSAEFVIAVCDVRCSVNEHDDPPKYRCYVNDELFTERTWIWSGFYLEESLQIFAAPGKYRVRYELVGDTDAAINYTNLQIQQGPAVISTDGAIHIYVPQK
jgi:hypothetical protein